MLTDSEIADRYRDVGFPGAFSGARNFQMFLKTDLNEDISLKRIYNVLKSQPFYVISQKAVRRFPRRPYWVPGFGILMQSDIAFMFEKMASNTFWC